MAPRTITMSLHKTCPLCGKKGVPCLACALKAIKAAAHKVGRKL